jgi:lysophospholipase L1-like esterase
MNRHYKVTVVLLALLSTAFFSASASTPAPRVVFIGDWVTYSWDGAFAANPNWINQGTPGQGLLGNGNSADTLARFQADVVDLHPAIVHIMIGSSDADEDDDAMYRLTFANFRSNLDSMVKEARAANIQVILGIEPQNLAFGGPIEPINSIVANYGAANKILVINYGDALCGCVGSTGAISVGYDFASQNALMVPATDQIASELIPSATGYALMTQMAEAAINTIHATVERGYLQNIEQANDNEDNGPTSNVDSVNVGAVVQFTPQALYRNGSVQPILNSNFAGSSGTWTSSNPLVMYVSQKGLAWSLSPGKAIITYTSPTGIRFSEWGMNITSGD